MKLSTIKLALSGEISTDVLRMEMQDEMSEYKAKANLIGSTMPVYLTEDTEIKIGESDLKALCTAYLNEKLTELEINYIVDALQMANNVTFESEELFDRISYLTDPEINGHLTRQIVLELMNHNKIKNLINMNDEDRYHYFISKISDFEIVWGLFDNGWAVLQSAETGGTNVPFWPEKEFAQICATGLWHNYSPKEITLEDFLVKWLPGMKTDGRNACVFMIPDSNNKCIVVDPGTLKNDIEKELENY